MSARSTARLAGLLYLLIAITGGFAQLVARGGVLIPGDAAATAANIRGNADIFRLGIAADAVNITAFVVMALLLHRLLSPTSPGLSRAFVALVAVSSAIMGLSLANHYGALVLATDGSYASALGTDAADALAGLFLNLHQFGYLIAEIFFGLWLVPLGLAVYRSGAFPRWMGVLLGIGGVSYLFSFAMSIASPGFHSDAATTVALPAAVAELAFMAWLLIRGADVPEHVPADATTSTHHSLATEVAR